AGLVEVQRTEQPTATEGRRLLEGGEGGADQIVETERLRTPGTDVPDLAARPRAPPQQGHDGVRHLVRGDEVHRRRSAPRQRRQQAVVQEPDGVVKGVALPRLAARVV